MDTKFLSQNSFSVENIVEIKSEQLIVIETISFLKIYQENMQDKTGISNFVATRVVSENKKTFIDLCKHHAKLQFKLPN